jgi:predicted hotdog family 3-hydroxylacyl-ACP dehydratase
MADPKIKIRRSSTPGKIPTTAQIELGELAINTYDGALYLKKNANSVETIVKIGPSEESGGVGNLDGGVPNSVYGGMFTVDAGGI